MSKLLTLSTERDSPIIYKFIKKLALNHGNLSSDFIIQENQFIQYYNRNFFHVYLYKEEPFETNGLMLHMKEYSLKNNTFGCYLDDFYLDCSLRGKGLGKKMLAELCNNLLLKNQNYIKVIFHKSLNLDKMYKHFGFVNHSEDHSLRLYEGISGDFINILRCQKQQSTIDQKIIAVDTDDDGCSSVYKAVITRSGLSCQYCGQLYFNSWRGYGLLFTDFCGDTAIVELHDFKQCALEILAGLSVQPEYIRSVWWQIYKNQHELSECIKSCDAANIYDDGWVISYLDREGMAALAKLSI